MVPPAVRPLFFVPRVLRTRRAPVASLDAATPDRRREVCTRYARGSDDQSKERKEAAVCYSSREYRMEQEARRKREEEERQREERAKKAEKERAAKERELVRA
jgi:hypothetical protein